VKHVVIIGGGIAGIETACELTDAGHWVTVIEKESKLGGKLNNWSYLFPDFTPVEAIKETLHEKSDKKDFTILRETVVLSVQRSSNKFAIRASGNQDLEADAVVIATGYELFDARRKEEYGYKIYDHVITSADLENLLLPENDVNSVLKDTPKRIAFVHCVGSRDEKSGNHYCSKVCCITGVKQAISVKELYPECEVMNFYMDLRMFGSGYEELYQEAQEKYGITFIRGRVSEAAPTFNGAIQVKAEDTLLGRPLRVTVDWLVLLVGMEPDAFSEELAKSLDMKREPSGFFEGSDKFLKPGYSTSEGVFMAGTCGGPASIPESVNQGRAAALSVMQFLSRES